MLDNDQAGKEEVHITHADKGSAVLPSLFFVDKSKNKL